VRAAAKVVCEMSREKLWRAMPCIVLASCWWAPRAAAQEQDADAGVAEVEDSGVPPPAEEPPAQDEAARAQEEAEIAAELSSIQGNAAEEEPPPPPPGGNASSRGLSNLMNPAISAVGLLLGGYSN